MLLSLGALGFGISISDRIVGALGILPLGIALYLRLRPPGRYDVSGLRLGKEAIPFDAVYRVQWLCSILIWLEYRTEDGGYETHVLESDTAVLDSIAGHCRKAGAQILERGRRQLFPKQPMAVAAGLFAVTLGVFFVAVALTGGR